MVWRLENAAWTCLFFCFFSGLLGGQAMGTGSESSYSTRGWEGWLRVSWVICMDGIKRDGQAGRLFGNVSKSMFGWVISLIIAAYHCDLKSSCGGRALLLLFPRVCDSVGSPGGHGRQRKQELLPRCARALRWPLGTAGVNWSIEGGRDQEAFDSTTTPSTPINCCSDSIVAAFCIGLS